MGLKKLIVLFALTLVSFTAFSQITVTGIVIQGDDGEPAIGATVTVKGTNTATATDLDGRFSIKAPSNDSKIIVNSNCSDNELLKTFKENISNKEKLNYLVISEIDKLDEEAQDKFYQIVKDREFFGMGFFLHPR